MLTRGWGPQRSVNDDPGRNQWMTVDSGAPGGLMLNSDLCLAYDNNSEHQECMKKENNNNRKCKKFQNKGKSINALETQCCAWTHKGALFNNRVLDKEAGKDMLCGAEVPNKGPDSKFEAVQDKCCANQHEDSTGDCDSSQWPKGQAFRNILDFAANETMWHDSFAEAWEIATENGHLDLKTLINYEDNEDEYECGRLRSKAICNTDPMCAW